MPARPTIVLLIGLAAPTTVAWSGESEQPHHAELADIALAALDANQTAGIRAHAAAYRQGALDADVGLPPAFHRYSPGSGDGRALDYVENASRALQVNLSTRDPTQEDARQLGILVHVLFDLTQPLHTGNGTIDAPHHAEYEAAAYQNARDPAIPSVQPSRDNITLLTREIAEASATRAPELETLLREEGPWSARIAGLTNETLQDGAPAVARALAAVLPPPPEPPTPPPETRTSTGTPVSSAAASPTDAITTSPMSTEGSKETSFSGVSAVLAAILCALALTRRRIY